MKYMVMRLRGLGTAKGAIQVSQYSLPEWELAEASRAMEKGAVVVGPLSFDSVFLDTKDRKGKVWTLARETLSRLEAA